MLGMKFLCPFFIVYCAFIVSNNTRHFGILEVIGFKVIELVGVAVHQLQ